MQTSLVLFHSGRANFSFANLVEVITLSSHNLVKFLDNFFVNFLQMSCPICSNRLSKFFLLNFPRSHFKSFCYYYFFLFWRGAWRVSMIPAFKFLFNRLTYHYLNNHTVLPIAPSIFLQIHIT